MPATPVARSSLLAICGVLVLFCVMPSRASAQTDRFGRDKALHLTVSASLTVGGYTVLHALDIDDSLALPVSVFAALGVGVGKELFDSVDGGQFSAADLAWDMLGITSGVLLVAAIRLAFGSRPIARAPARAGPVVPRATSSSGSSDRTAGS
jgi:putative lipoprotein